MPTVTCIECGLPWGVILERGEEPTAERVEVCRQELVELLIAECWDYGYDTDDFARIDTSLLPPVRVATVVYLSAALAKFCDEHGICEPTFMDDCWQDIRDVDLPLWLVKGRKQRTAVLWDCCNIGHPEDYMLEVNA